jgi:predicted Fe-S protein YdhL (DUF1289 family)
MRKMIKSPCVKLCQQNEDGICLGCFRTNQEIIDWYNLTPVEQLEVRRKATERRNEIRGDDYYGFPR